MRIRLASVLLLLAVAGCAAPVAPPLEVRQDLNPQWINPAGGLRWPDHNGFAQIPIPVVLPPGMLIDRFGLDSGRFFSPKGAAYRGRALPHSCAMPSYTAFEVVRPVLAWTGTATSWFGEPVGATQFMTDANAAMLVADGALRPLPAREPSLCPAK